MRWEPTDKTPELEWEDPPPAQRAGRPALWKDRLAPLVANPGRWGKFEGVQAVQGTRIAQGVYGPGFEVTSRNTTGRSGPPTLYVRYVGEKEET